MNSLNYRTKFAKNEEVERKWHLIDAENMVVGRVCSQIATLLRGKHKPSYTPNVDTGDYVVVINADLVRFTGDKMKQKEYITYSGYPGGQKSKKAEEVMAKFPERIIENAVRGMLPKNRLGRQMFNKLFVYTGGEHPHQAQKPEPYKI
ncbi:MAG: 50S ribosomal protein L13 [Saprospiraceae bacterium]|nr:50S ribosomal protein L13 [Saprospiraceae bacterium]